MRRLLLGAAAAVAFAATPAAADVLVFGFMEKEKDVYVHVDIDIYKDIYVHAYVYRNPEKGAEASTHVNQTNTDNHACENCAEKEDVIDDSVNDNSGIVSVNQATGNMNNQGNAVSIAVTGIGPDDDPDTNGAVAHAQSWVDQRNGFYFDIDDDFEHGDIGLGNTVNSINIIFRDATISGSVNDNSGGVHVNQAAGNVNNQTNVFTAAIGQDAGVALSDSALGQTNIGNNVFENRVNKSANINGSVLGNSGVVGVNQTSGNMANQANVITLGAASVLQ